MLHHLFNVGPLILLTVVTPAVVYIAAVPPLSDADRAVVGTWRYFGDDDEPFRDERLTASRRCFIRSAGDEDFRPYCRSWRVENGRVVRSCGEPVRRKIDRLIVQVTGIDSLSYAPWLPRDRASYCGRASFRCMGNITSLEVDEPALAADPFPNRLSVTTFQQTTFSYAIRIGD